jgi:hypothetical protein
MTTYLGYDIQILKRPRPAIRQVTRLDVGKFLLKYKNLPSFELEMDFSPFAKIFNLRGAYTLLHWQAIPKGLRTWGAYVTSPDRDEYLVFDYPEFESSNHPHQLLQIDEVLVNTKPTAVIYYPDRVMVKVDNKWRMEHDHN